MEQERHRIISFEQAAEAFTIQLQSSPSLMAEFGRLVGSSVGIIDALIVNIANEISYTPVEETTPERMRDIVGAPDDPEQLDEWRVSFWDRYKADHDLD